MLTLADTGAVYNVPRLVPISSPWYVPRYEQSSGQLATATMMSINIFPPCFTNNCH